MAEKTLGVVIGLKGRKFTVPKTRLNTRIKRAVDRDYNMKLLSKYSPL